MRMLRDNNNPTAAVDASSAALLLVTPASAAAAGGVLQPPPAGGSDASFDADMVIILAAMLCVLVCAIGLDSLIRCVRLHCGRTRTPTVAAARHAAATMAAAADAIAGPKKREQIMRRIPVVVYEARAGVSATECAICLGEFEDGEKVRVLPRCYTMASMSSASTCGWP
ncbi:hypothetical protein PVAP13_3KG042000 [Panicum virgatum]|uniref:Uncharacterized protein n=1 Tax=Panicum virgatum TaxID=38727 RepID=A0A8T0PBY5_PANVG|nr:hypothetical protein PVAP13_8KG022200 [Panicum virgatum]KAG2622692.1 hypothetical protein PVAP13_3KG042000 [Panicum virgatum]